MSYLNGYLHIGASGHVVDAGEDGVPEPHTERLVHVQEAHWSPWQQ